MQRGVTHRHLSELSTHDFYKEVFVHPFKKIMFKQFSEVSFAVKYKYFFTENMIASGAIAILKA